MKIWNTEDWSLAETISKPFETSPQSTFFRRLSWSPDGAFIAASNAMNGPVFVAAVIDREGWASDISFVGHENTIQVAVSILNYIMIYIVDSIARRSTLASSSLKVNLKEERRLPACLLLARMILASLYGETHFTSRW